MISVVIPAYNEEKLIKLCLDAFIKQKTTKNFEIILVNNNSTDKTADIAKSYEDKLNLKIVSEKIKGRGAARKKGFTEANGEIILSTDADTVVSPNWVEKLVNSLEKSDAIAVSGTCKIADCNSVTNVIINFLQPFSMRLYKLFFGHYWLSGFSFAIYKNEYNRSGGFSPKLNVQEDIDLSFNVSRIGKIKFIPDLPVIFSGRRFQKGLVKGLFPYLSTFLNYFLYKKDDVILSDVR
jgi:glycosyltransferase involved in cell wall biosynthesis